MRNITNVPFASLRIHKWTRRSVVKRIYVPNVICNCNRIRNRTVKALQVNLLWWTRNRNRIPVPFAILRNWWSLLGRWNKYNRSNNNRNNRCQYRPPPKILVRVTNRSPIPIPIRPPQPRHQVLVHRWNRIPEWRWCEHDLVASPRNIVIPVLPIRVPRSNRKWSASWPWPYRNDNKSKKRCGHNIYIRWHWKSSKKRWNDD